MPIENMEEEGLAKIPDLKLAQLKFQLQSVERFKVRGFFLDLIMFGDSGLVGLCID